MLVEKEQFGHSENFIPTYIATRQTIGEIVNVKLTSINNDHMIGTVVN
ncbi:miaB-like tRNA modifying enzyme domain protein [Orientia tsutsugamushi str. TA716]|uniref:MiaB-like tRNA modifying enzyme domain protein n=1 Tax=Orientia tsutsugamushi str. TA716 TaxID=1359175 RepID=A0A0F3NXU3_ORITS|nr:miaB-like tRNA modifying enzyme domain protein [Orientia tsutsugamushi str. TA716]